MPDKNIANSQYIHGDFDKDKTPNIDDKYPFDSSRSNQVQEVSLSDELKRINHHNSGYKGLVNQIKAMFKDRKMQYRIKGTHSTIGKLRRKYLGEISDILAFTIFCKNEQDIKQMADRIHAMFGNNVISDQDYYQEGKLHNKHYMARHLTIEIEGKLVELQLKTQRHWNIHREVHPLYKQYKPLPKSDYMTLIHRARKARRMDAGG